MYGGVTKKQAEGCDSCRSAERGGSERAPRVYLDNAAATAVDERVLAAMEPYWWSDIGNSGSLHEEGTRARAAVEQARAEVAAFLGARPQEIIFTSGGTEANNLAILGSLRTHGKSVHERFSCITSAIEHSSVSDCFRALSREGVDIKTLAVDRNGFVLFSELRAALSERTALVSIMYANNEIGTIEHIAEIAREVRRAQKVHEHRGTLLHTDASQTPAWLPIRVEKLGVDLLTLDSQKVYGPKGIGCLYRKEGVALEPLMYGGGQEFGLRPGTPPTALIVGFATALSLAERERASYVPRVAMLRDRLARRLEDADLGAIPHGPVEGGERLPNMVNVSFPGLDAEQVVIELSARGVSASTRSACLLGDEPGSPVVAALGKGEVCATSSVRFSLSRYTTEAEIDRAADATIEVVRFLKRCASL